MRNVTYKRRHVCWSVRMEQLESHWTDFHEISYLSIFRKSVMKIPVFLKPDRNNVYFTWTLCKFTIRSRWILLRLKNVSDKSCRRNQNTHFVFNKLFSLKSCFISGAKNNVQPDKPQMTRRMCFACWIPKAIKHTLRICNTYAILLTSVSRYYVTRALPVLCHTHISAQVFPTKLCTNFSSPPCMPHARPSHPFSYDNPDDIWWAVQAMKPLSSA